MITTFSRSECLFVVDWFNSEDSTRVTHEGGRAFRRAQEDERQGQTAGEGS